VDDQRVDEIANPRTGQRMTFVTDTPELLEIDTANPPSEIREPEHVHPKQESGCRVISGELRWEVDGEARLLSAGDSITIPAGVPHHFWNPADEEAQALQWFRPALRTREFFEKLFGLAQDGQLKDDGMPKLLQLAVLVPEFGDEIRPTSPPWPVLRSVTAVLGPVARARGYR
jgi:mannose-6-phosphate isomerase-like protein (cupin superfamily)